MFIQLTGYYLIVTIGQPAFCFVVVPPLSLYLSLSRPSLRCSGVVVSGFVVVVSVRIMTMFFSCNTTQSLMYGQVMQNFHLYQNHLSFMIVFINSRIHILQTCFKPSDNTQDSVKFTFTFNHMWLFQKSQRNLCHRHYIYDTLGVFQVPTELFDL